MKTLIFVFLVVGAGTYLAAQTDIGVGWLSTAFPTQKINQTAEQLKQQIDEHIEVMNDERVVKQQKTIDELQKRIAYLEHQVAPKSEFNFIDLPKVQGVELTTENNGDPMPDRQTNSNNNTRQLSLQEITTRMQNLSISAGSQG